MRPARLRAAAVLVCLAPLPLAAQDIGPVRFNQDVIEARSRGVAVDEPLAVFRQVFARLADEIEVYPTENYYYFSFEGNGRTYSGNFRLHPEERDRGLINFAYFDTSDPSWFRHLLLGADDGVTVARAGPLAYRVSFDGKSVIYRLNDLAQDDPGPPAVAPGEVFVGRGMDESGLVFTLAYSPAIEQFVWVLDPAQKMEAKLAPAGGGLSVHIPSGFGFLQRPGSGRALLVAVHEHEVVRNTWNDGPFDQLPDNWLPETRFRELAERSDPAVRGVINDRGEFRGLQSRMAVTPYVQYRTLEELVRRHARCAAPSAADVLVADCMRQVQP